MNNNIKKVHAQRQLIRRNPSFTSLSVVVVVVLSMAMTVLWPSANSGFAEARQADDRSKFLYIDNPSAKEVVWEYQSHMHAPHFVLEDISDLHKEFSAKIQTKNSTETKVQPFFLRSEYPIPRVVAFYSPWCGACQQFVPRYISTASAILKRLPPFHVEFFAVSCSEHHDLCQTENIRAFPTIYAYRSYNDKPTKIETFTIPVIDETLRLNLPSQAAFDGRDSKGQPEVLRDEATGQTENVDTLDILGATQDGYRHTRIDVYRDAALSFTYALENHIFEEGQQELTDVQTDAFSEWLDMLYWTLPPTWMVHALINDLRQNLHTVKKDKKFMLTIVKAHQPVVHDQKDMQWSEGCRNGEGVVASFSCGLWSLFHIVSVGVPERQAAVLGHRTRVTTTHVAETLKDYITHFFPWCPQCREQFLQLYGNCAFNRCRRFKQRKGKQRPSEQTFQEFPIWLWEVHNDINEKLMAKEAHKLHKRKATAAELERSRWPPKDACMSCYKPNGHWIQPHVYEYLKEEYW